EHIKTDRYIADLEEFIHRLHSVLPHTPLLLTTPSPMLDHRRDPNKWAAEYTAAIIQYGEEHHIAVYDLFHALGGHQNIRTNYDKGLYFRDYIHYTQKGYRHSGDLFSEAFLNAFYRTTHKPLLDER